MSVARSGALEGAGGLRLFWQAWLPTEAPRAIVIIVHGVGEHSDRYAHVADHLTDDGCAVYALDHRGHGRSQGPREVIESVDDALADLDVLVTLAIDSLGSSPSVPVFMLGHSFGGMLAVRYALARQQRLSGLILSGALAMAEASPALRAVGHLISRVAPRAPLIRLDAGLVSRDPAVVAAYREDPLVHHGWIPARTAAEIADTVDAFPDQVGAITLPTLILYGTADGLVSPEGSVMLSQRIGSSDVTVHAYEGLYHEVLNEPEQATVLADISAWLAQRIPAAPPAAASS